MEKPLSLTLRYSAGIGGDLALLPRMFTLIQQLRARANQPALLLDLGGTCADSVWHCRATGGRSALIVLDGMGYHAANVEARWMRKTAPNWQGKSQWRWWMPREAGPIRYRQ